MVVKKIRTRKNKEPERAKEMHFCKSLADSLAYAYLLLPRVSMSLGFFKLLFTACWPLVQKRETGQCCSQDVCWQVLGDSRLSPIEIEEQHFTPTLPLVVGVCVVDDIYPSTTRLEPV